MANLNVCVIGFKTEQENGCRFLSPKYDGQMAGFIPPSGSEIYISRLPFNSNEQELYQFASTVGPVFDVRLMVTFNGSTRGFGFIRYFDSETAEIAVKQLNSRAFRCNRHNPWHICAQKSTDQRSLLLIGLKLQVTKGEIEQFFNNVHPQQLVRVEYNSDETPFYALEFVSHKAAAKCKRVLNFPSSWGQVQLIWQPNREVQERIKLKKVRENSKRLVQKIREKFLLCEDNHNSGTADQGPRGGDGVTARPLLPMSSTNDTESLRMRSGEMRGLAGNLNTSFPVNAAAGNNFPRDGSFGENSSQTSHLGLDQYTAHPPTAVNPFFTPPTKFEILNRSLYTFQKPCCSTSFMF